jgi:uncharacterized protein
MHLLRADWFATGDHNMNPFTQPGAFSWCELLTSEPEAACDFYRQLFGWSLKKGQIGSTPYTVIEIGGHEIGAIAPLPPNAPNMQPTWGTYVTVEDVDQAIVKVDQLGGKVLIKPIDIPPAGRFVLIQDPQGAMIALISYTQQT